VETILSEVNNLPYQNTIKAFEFWSPSLMTNGTVLLYIIEFPKVTAESYWLMHLYSTISEGKQVMQKYTKFAVNLDETYAVLGNWTKCSSSRVFRTSFCCAANPHWGLCRVSETVSFRNSRVIQ